MKNKPKYPIYVPSKGRSHAGHTISCLLEDGVAFFLVVEPSEEDAYREAFPKANILVTPKDNMRLLGARKWIRNHSETVMKAKRHWQFDDNIRDFYRLQKGLRIRCNANFAIKVVEDFTDRYTNIGISGMNYDTFAIGKMPPFYLNNHVYSASLINNDIEVTWREYYNDDTDICLQALSKGWCTVLVNAVLVGKINTMVVKGGNTDDLYQSDGRLKMARALERKWPYVVTTGRRFKRPQHIVKGAWRKFDTQLIRRKDIDWSKIKGVDNYGMELKALKKVESPELQKFMDDENKNLKR